MKIKRLELCGFKSFVDRTVVSFDEEVMGIVGPNGCGKSNIVDAIRWAMGEQSAKHLRGRSMEDVIFNGSESRPGADFAEVTLTFDNDDPDSVPPEHREYAQIAVTRRLHRSGDSEYLINKTHVRLKDVTDLFLGTGAGTKAYAIVEQGKIGLIVSAKPEDRRMLIEEAAGITRFKARKKQAERKMEQTQQNLLRVGDIVSEIERSLGSLKRQAAKAERFLAYRAELEDLRLYEASHRFLEIDGWIKYEGAEVEAHGAVLAAAKAELAGREAGIDLVREETLRAEGVLEAASNDSFARENDVRTVEASMDRARDRRVALCEREAAATQEAVELEAQRAALSDELALVRRDLGDLALEDALGADGLAAEEAHLAEVARGHDDASRQVDEARAAIAQAQTEIASAEAKLEGFERRRAETEARHEKVTFEREEFGEQARELARKVVDLGRGIEELRAGKVTSAEEKARLGERLSVLKQEIIASDRAVDDAKHEVQKKRSRLHALTEVEARLDGVGAGTRALVATHDPCVLGLVADRIEAPPELTYALAGLLGPRLSEVIVDDQDRAVELLRALAAGKKGRATVLPRAPRYVAGAPLPEHADDPGFIARLRDVVVFAPENEALVASLVGDAIVVRDADSARRLAGRVRAATVTLDGTVFWPDGRISGGTGDEHAAGMLETRREIRELHVVVDDLDRIASQRLAEHQALRGEIGGVQSALEIARENHHASEVSLAHATQALRAAEAQHESTTRRLGALADELRELDLALSEAAGDRERASAVLDAARAVLDERTVGLAALEAHLAAWREDLEGVRETVLERKIKVAGVKEKLSASEKASVRLERSTEELAERRRRLEDEMASGAAEIGELVASLFKLAESLLVARGVAASARATLADARAAFEALRESLSERESGLRDARASAELAREALAAHEMALRERTLALEHLLTTVADGFRGLRLERVIGDHHLKPPPDEETRARIGELSNLLDRMGSVNLDAMREHAEAEVRHTDYATQKADLDQALRDLERAIQLMNRESRRMFRDTFDLVNARFQEIFPRMFRGGRASLHLTNPEDMLETGIEIMAQPPGKKLSSIELMSGGEKALTAVSLIFAIFQIKPSPFCILDEVDAPLDEANVARYNEMIRTMTDRSQFILITHVKRTMQMVDTLYGVTMQEPGISRLVTVKMSEGVEKKKGLRDTTAGAVAPAEAQVA